MNNTLRFYFLLARLSIGALALALGLLTLTALARPDFAAVLAVQGMPTPLTWPAALLECLLALLAFFPPSASAATSGTTGVRPDTDVEPDVVSDVR